MSDWFVEGANHTCGDFPPEENEMASTLPLFLLSLLVRRRLLCGFIVHPTVAKELLNHGARAGRGVADAFHASRRSSRG